MRAASLTQNGWRRQGPGPEAERSSFFLFFVSAGQRFPPHRRTSGEFRMGGGVHDSYRTHSSADWWGLLLPLA